MTDNNKKYKGVIFDFNGTLFWDTPFHNIAWNKFLEKHGKSFTPDEFFRLIHGKNNKELLTNIFDGKLSDEQIQEYIIEKETMYMDICKERNYLSLAPGAIEFIEFLRQNKIPYTIATASGIENIEFYIEFIKIGNWFDTEKIVYNDGTMRGKPNPDLYLKAIDVLGIPADDLIVFEDAIAGLQAARNAHAGKIFVVDSNGDDYEDWADCTKITNFDQVDRSIFSI